MYKCICTCINVYKSCPPLKDFPSIPISLSSCLPLQMFSNKEITFIHCIHVLYYMYTYEIPLAALFNLCTPYKNFYCAVEMECIFPKFHGYNVSNLQVIVQLQRNILLYYVHVECGYTLTPK